MEQEDRTFYQFRLIVVRIVILLAVFIFGLSEYSFAESIPKNAFNLIIGLIGGLAFALTFKA